MTRTKKMLGGVSRTALAAACAAFVPVAALGLSNEVLDRGQITPLGDVLMKAGVKVPVRVASNAELKAYRYGGVARRNGFLTAASASASMSAP